MTAGVLVARIWKMRKYPQKTWGLFEVIAKGGAECPLHKRMPSNTIFRYSTH